MRSDFAYTRLVLYCVELFHHTQGLWSGSENAVGGGEINTNTSTVNLLTRPLLGYFFCAKHPPIRGGDVKTFRWDLRLQDKTSSMAFKRVPPWYNSNIGSTVSKKPTVTLCVRTPAEEERSLRGGQV